jgi:hypothetical protein
MVMSGIGITSGTHLLFKAKAVIKSALLSELHGSKQVGHMDGLTNVIVN